MNSNFTPKFDNAIFDADGTIFDTYPGLSRCVRYAFDMMKKPQPPEEVIRSFLGPALYISFLGCGFTEEETLEAIGHYRKLYTEGAIFECEIFSGTLELFETLKKSGVKISIASAKPQPSLHKLVEHFHLESVFDKVVGAPLNMRDSDKAVFIKNATVGDKPIMVGDRIFDFEGAEKNGIPSVGVSYGFGTPDELKKATYVVDTPAAIADIVLYGKDR